MAEPDESGLVAFDDGPELSKLKGWYDRVRESAKEAGQRTDDAPTPSGTTASRGD